MMICTRLLSVSLIAALATTTAITAAPVLTIDPVTTNTLVFRDYNGAGDVHVSYGGSGPAPSQSVSGGTSAWTYASGVTDPQISYNDGAGVWDHGAYPWARFRLAQGRAGTGNAQYWENPPRGGEGPQLGAAATLTEFTADAPNAAPNGTGFRIDPFGAAVAGDVFALDYVLMDTFQTRGFAEWDTAGDQQGWNVLNASGVTVANGTIGGTATTGDLQVNSGAGQIDAGVHKYVEIRLKASGGAAELFWGQNGGYTGTQRISFGANDGQWHTYLLDFTAEPTWTGADMRLRIDANNGIGQTFEIDYVRVREGSYGIGNAFTQAVDTDWNTSGNWSLGRVPVNGDQPLVTGHTAVVSAVVPDVGAVTVGNAGSLQVTTGGALNVGGNVSVGVGGAGTLSLNGGALTWRGKLLAQAGAGAITVSGTAPTVTGTRADGGAALEIQNGASLNFVFGANGVAPVTLNGNGLAALAAASILSVDGAAYTGGAATVTLISHHGYAGVGAFGTVTLTGFGGLTGAVSYAADAVNLVLSYRDCVPVRNPSFQTDRLLLPAPAGYGAITDWDWYGAGGNRGVNPYVGGGMPFADNGTIPDQDAIAFIQANGAIGQTLTGLDTGSTYWLQFWYNARNGNTPELKAEFAGATLVDWTRHSAVGGTNPYNFTNVVFTPAAHSGVLKLHSRTPAGDNSSLFDAVCVVRRTDPFEVPLKNPGFEASGKTPGIGQASPIAGWDGLGTGVNDTSQPFFDNGRNPDGTYVAYLQNNVGGLRYLRQPLVNLVPGQRYRLGYAYNQRASGTGPMTLTVTVGTATLFNGTLSGAVASAGNRSVPFNTTNYTFTAASSSAVLAFETPASPDDRTLLLDDIHLVAIPDEGTLFILK